MKLLIVVGTRPNFVKITQFKKLATHFESIEIRIVHTGQHADDNMSKVFFRQFELEPDAYLPLTQSTPSSQMGEIMIGLEAQISDYKPDMVMVVGDVNSTLAGAIVANKMKVPLSHLESGLRSRDRSMPEEINRILTDQVADHLFVTEESGLQNIKDEKLPGQAYMVGNTMIDTLVAFEGKIQDARKVEELGLERRGYGLMTMHRPATVDRDQGLKQLLDLIESLASRCPLVFPIHPRTMKNLERFNLKGRLEAIAGLILTQPMDYFAFQNLLSAAKYVITDSGGIQEETTFGSIPCFTLRPTTERPSTTDLGTNTIARFDVDEVAALLDQVEGGTYKQGVIPPMWDGNATERVLKVLSAI